MRQASLCKAIAAAQQYIHSAIEIRATGERAHLDGAMLASLASSLACSAFSMGLTNVRAA